MKGKVRDITTVDGRNGRLGVTNQGYTECTAILSVSAIATQPEVAPDVASVALTVETRALQSDPDWMHSLQEYRPIINRVFRFAQAMLAS